MPLQRVSTIIKTSLFLMVNLKIGHTKGWYREMNIILESKVLNVLENIIANTFWKAANVSALYLWKIANMYV